MSRRISRFSVVALVALTAVGVCIVFVVLRRFSEPPIVYEDEIPVVDTNEIPVFAAEVSTISLPIKADYAALAGVIQDEARKEIKVPGPIEVNSNRYTIYDITVSQLYFYYTADLLSLDFSLGDGSAVAASVAAMRRVLEGLKGTLGAKFAQAQIERLREQEISLADCPVLNVKGEIQLHGPIPKKSFGEYIATLMRYDGRFRFSKSYSVRLDESAKLIFRDLGQTNMEPLGRASVKVGPVPFEDWFGGLKKLIMPEVGKKVNAALTKHVKVDYLTPFYDTGWVVLHNPIKLTSGVWLVLVRGYSAAQFRHHARNDAYGTRTPAGHSRG